MDPYLVNIIDFIRNVFERVHESVIPISRIKAIEKHHNGQYQVLLKSTLRMKIYGIFHIGVSNRRQSIGEKRWHSLENKELSSNQTIQ